MAKAKVNDACIGCGACVGMAPDVFDIGDDGLAITLIDGDLGDKTDDATQAAQICPVEAIEVE